MKKQLNIWKDLPVKPSKKNLLLLLLVGILLIVIAIPTETKEIGVGNTDIEKRLEEVLGQIEGAGKVQVMITYKEDESIEGIAVVSDGGDNAVVVRTITEVVQALFDVKTHKIKVIKGNYLN